MNANATNAVYEAIAPAQPTEGEKKGISPFSIADLASDQKQQKGQFLQGITDFRGAREKGIIPLFWVVLLGALALLVSGCDRQQPLAPPEVQYGQSECADCGMIVSDQRYAAGLILETAQGDFVPRVFDDIGCMIKYEQHQKDGKVLAHYVKDYQTSQWLTVEKAVLVHRQQIQSPMAYGLAAAGNREDAQKLAGGDAQAITDYATLLRDIEPKADAHQADVASTRQ